MRRIWIAAAAAVIAGAGVGAEQVVREQNIEIRVAGTPGDLALLAGGSLEPMETGTGVIVGRAVDAGGNSPVPGALVTLSLPGVSPLRVLADGQGRFAFQGLPSGRFSLSATKAGYVEGAYGRRRPSGPTQVLQLDDDEGISEVVLALWRLGALTGRVVDERGDPVIAATVQAYARTTVAGMPKLTAAATDQTDDRGIFRMGMLEPGDYVVSIPSPQDSGMQTFIFGGGGSFNVMRRSAAVSAALDTLRNETGGRISISGPENLSGPAGLDADGTPLTFPGLDFQLTPVRTAMISGTVLGPEGPAPNVTLDLLPIGSDEFATPILAGSARSDAQGTFEFSGVAPGQYTLRVVQSPRVALAGQGETTVVSSGGATYAMRSVTRIAGPGGSAVPPLPDEPTLWAEMPIVVADADVDTAVTLSTGLKVTGQVEFIGGVPQPERDRLPSVGITLDPADGRTSGLGLNARGRISPEGLFETVGVPPGKYFVRVSGAPQGWLFRGATLGGRDITDLPLELDTEDVTSVMLTFTDQETELTGSVTGATGATDSGAIVLVFPARAEGWINYGSRPRRLQSARVDETGAFRIGGLPAGDYLVAAVPDEIAGDWQNPAFLQSLAPVATSVRLEEGQRQSQSLQVVRR
jgi:hypothetical protein